ncbi:hypothetical protein HK405_001265 [Cladochytrium tenue]|nr:hypothetical protein HK405_001265 [Cladochytrium tenue]
MTGTQDDNEGVLAATAAFAESNGVPDATYASDDDDGEDIGDHDDGEAAEADPGATEAGAASSNHMAAGQDAGGTAQKKPQPVIACDRCREKKRRCDGKKPICTNCSKARTRGVAEDMICVYQAAHQKRGRKKRPPGSKQQAPPPASAAVFESVMAAIGQAGAGSQLDSSFLANLLSTMAATAPALPATASTAFPPLLSPPATVHSQSITPRQSELGTDIAIDPIDELLKEAGMVDMDMAGPESSADLLPELQSLSSMDGPLDMSTIGQLQTDGLRQAPESADLSVAKSPRMFFGQTPATFPTWSFAESILTNPVAASLAQISEIHLDHDIFHNFNVPAFVNSDVTKVVELRRPGQSVYEDLTTHLVVTFFSLFNPFLRLFSEDDFFQKFYPVNRHPESLIFAIMGFTAPYSEHPVHEPSRAFIPEHLRTDDADDVYLGRNPTVSSDLMASSIFGALPSALDPEPVHDSLIEWFGRLPSHIKLFPSFEVFSDLNPNGPPPLDRELPALSRPTWIEINILLILSLCSLHDPCVDTHDPGFSPTRPTLRPMYRIAPSIGSRVVDSVQMGVIAHRALVHVIQQVYYKEGHPVPHAPSHPPACVVPGPDRATRPYTNTARTETDVIVDLTGADPADETAYAEHEPLRRVGSSGDRLFSRSRPPPPLYMLADQQLPFGIYSATMNVATAVVPGLDQRDGFGPMVGLQDVDSPWSAVLDIRHVYLPVLRSLARLWKTAELCLDSTSELLDRVLAYRVANASIRSTDDEVVIGNSAALPSVTLWPLARAALPPTKTEHFLSATHRANPALHRYLDEQDYGLERLANIQRYNWVE